MQWFQNGYNKGCNVVAHYLLVSFWIEEVTDPLFILMLFRLISWEICLFCFVFTEKKESIPICQVKANLRSMCYVIQEANYLCNFFS